MTAITKLQGLATAAGFALTLFVGGANYAAAEDVTLRMAVPDWPPTRIMKDMFDKEYKPASGNKVTLDVDFIPWPDFYTRVNASLTSVKRNTTWPFQIHNGWVPLLRAAISARSTTS